jgi:N-acetylneuraminate synthase
VKVVAELSCNHQGTLERAHELVHAAALAGAHAIKLQTWTSDTMVLDRAVVLESGPWAGHNLSQLYAEAHTPWEWHRPLFEAARAHGMEAFSSVFDLDALELLEGLECPRYKIASFELVDIPLIRAVAKTGKPIILSTGMATRPEVQDAVEAARDGGARDITLLQCTSAYPATGADANLRTMRDFLSLGCQIGLSDHTPGIGVALVAAAWGATMIEKHFTLSRAAGGLDAAFSLEPDELAALVREIPNVVNCLGKMEYGPKPSEIAQRDLRRSLYFAKDMRAGAYVGKEHVVTARPALGLPPRFYGTVLGSKLLVDVRAGQRVTWEELEKREVIQ